MLLLSFESNLPPPDQLHRGPLYFRGLNLHLGSTRVGVGDGDPHRVLPQHDLDRCQSAADDDEPLTPGPPVIVAAEDEAEEEGKESRTLRSSAEENTSGSKAAGMQTSNCKDFASARCTNKNIIRQSVNPSTTK